MPFGNAGYVEQLLAHLALTGFCGAPRFLGYDEFGRQMVTFVPGLVPPGPPFQLSDAQLASAARLVHTYHDATASSPLRGDAEVVSHGELGPYNTIFDGDTAVALLDFGDQVGPGSRAADFAHAAWCFSDLAQPDVAVAEQSRRTRLMCDTYPGMSGAAVVVELRALFVRGRSRSVVTGNHARTTAFTQLLSWLEENSVYLV
jgi:aminoglycoside phosphotransferase (APT) family kinase protein